MVITDDQAGKVVGIDHIPELVDWSVNNMKRDELGAALDKKQVEMITGDGRQGNSFVLNCVLFVNSIRCHRVCK